MIEKIPFMLRLSKHEAPFFGNLLTLTVWTIRPSGLGTLVLE